MGDGDDELFRISDGFTVAVFASDFDGDRDFGDAFEPVFRGEAGVVAGSRRQNQDAVDAAE